jgi:hypothetical protein
MLKKSNNKKSLTHKQIGIVIAAFAVLLLGGVVYAATTGVMNINGAVSRGANVDLDFTVASCSLQTTSGVPAGGGVSLTGIGAGDYNCGISIGDHAGSNGANDVLNWGVFLRSPGDTVTVSFSISNVGAVDAALEAINISTQTGFGSAAGQIQLSGSGTTIPAQTIPVGQTAGPYQITVTWPAGDATATDGANFAATLNYSQAP